MKALRLFLFSDHRIPENHRLDKRILEVAGTSSPSVAWIPAGSRPEMTSKFFEDRQNYYADLGVTNVEMFLLHQDFTKNLIPWLLDHQIIHLSGGDPFIFLRNLRSTGLMEVLQKWAFEGGILVGDSAGAMLMGPDIEIARFGHIPVPEDLVSLSSLGLTYFEFHPHLGTYGASVEMLQAYSQQKRVTVYGAPDGCGLALIDGKIELYGEVAYFKGESDLPGLQRKDN